MWRSVLWGKNYQENLQDQYRKILNLKNYTADWFFRGFSPDFCISFLIAKVAAGFLFIEEDCMSAKRKFFWGMRFLVYFTVGSCQNSMTVKYKRGLGICSLDIVWIARFFRAKKIMSNSLFEKCKFLFLYFLKERFSILLFCFGHKKGKNMAKGKNLKWITLIKSESLFIKSESLPSLFT